MRTGPNKSEKLRPWKLAVKRTREISARFSLSNI